MAQLPGKVSAVPGEFTLRVSTLPTTPYLQISFDGNVSETGPDGTFSITKPTGNYSLQAFREAPISASSKAFFDRWGDLVGLAESFQPTRTIELTSDKNVSLLVRLAYRVSMEFSDPEGGSVDIAIVENVLLQSNSGQSYLLESYTDLWFEANRFQQLPPPANWKIITNTYTAVSANVTGRNVVQRGLFVFTPGLDDVWRVSLLLYSLTVSTLPITPKLQILFDGNVTETGPDGTFSVTRPAGNYSLQAFQETALNATSKAVFDRWGDLIGRAESFQPTRTIDLTSDKNVSLLVRLSNRVSMEFSDPDGGSVDGAMVENVLLQSNSGQTYLLESYTDLWFEANRFQQLPPPANWKVITNTYTTVSANVTGRNVVQRGLFVFAPSPGQVWNISLLLYSLRVTVSDLFFGTHLEATVRISDLSTGEPVSSIRTIGGQAYWELFPRGDYVIRVSVSGFALQVPIIFTRPTSETIRVLSFVDLGLLLGVSTLGLAIFRWRNRIFHMWNNYINKANETLVAATGNRRARGH